MTTDRLPLRDGPTVQADVIRWLLAAGDRGLTLELRPAGRFGVTPRPAPGSDDDVFCRAHRNELAALLNYAEAVSGWPLDRIGTPWPLDAVTTAAPLAIAAPLPAPPPPAPASSSPPTAEPIVVSLFARGRV